MQAVITDGKGHVKLENIPMVKPAPWQCLCRIDACATCSGTDQKLVNHLFDWADQYPAILGHESVGTIIECGSEVKNFKPGQRVLRPAVALPGTMYGELASWMGGFAEYGLITDIAVVPPSEREKIDPFGYTRYQQVLPDDLDISNADATLLVMLKEVSAACQGVGVARGQNVLVLGSGAVAQAMCYFCSSLGAKVIVAARRAEPLERCIRCGAHKTVNLTEDDLESVVNDATSGCGIHRIMDAAGSIELVIRSSALLADGGGIASYATLDGGRFPSEQILARGRWELLTSTLAECDTHDAIISAIRRKELDPALFYTHKMDFADFETGFPMLAKKEAGKIVFEISGKN